MTECEICETETSEGYGDDPANDDYFTYVGTDNNGQTIEYEFCSFDHLRLFVPADPAER